MKQIYFLFISLLFLLLFSANSQSKWIKFQKVGSQVLVYLEVSSYPVTFVVNTSATLGVSALRISSSVLPSFNKGSHNAFCEDWVFVGMHQNTLVFDVFYDRMSISPSDAIYDFMTEAFKKGFGTEEYANTSNTLCVLGNKNYNESVRHKFYIPMDSDSISPRLLVNKASTSVSFDPKKFTVGIDLKK